jgi:hypothetical protein
MPPEEALEWAKRIPNPAGDGRDAEVEVRQFFEMDDFAPGPAVDQAREMEKNSRKINNPDVDFIDPRST